MANLNYSIRFA